MEALGITLNATRGSGEARTGPHPPEKSAEAKGRWRRGSAARATARRSGQGKNGAVRLRRKESQMLEDPREVAEAHRVAGTKGVQGRLGAAPSERVSPGV